MNSWKVIILILIIPCKMLHYYCNPLQFNWHFLSIEHWESWHRCEKYHHRLDSSYKYVGQKFIDRYTYDSIRNISVRNALIGRVVVEIFLRRSHQLLHASSPNFLCQCCLRPPSAHFSHQTYLAIIHGNHTLCLGALSLVWFILLQYTKVIVSQRKLWQ